MLGDCSESDPGNSYRVCVGVRCSGGVPSIVIFVIHLKRRGRWARNKTRNETIGLRNGLGTWGPWVAVDVEIGSQRSPGAKHVATCTCVLKVCM